MPGRSHWAPLLVARAGGGNRSAPRAPWAIWRSPPEAAPLRPAPEETGGAPAEAAHRPGPRWSRPSRSRRITALPPSGGPGMVRALGGDDPRCDLAAGLAAVDERGRRDAAAGRAARRPVAPRPPFVPAIGDGVTTGDGSAGKPGDRSSGRRRPCRAAAGAAMAAAALAKAFPGHPSSVSALCRRTGMPAPRPDRAGGAGPCPRQDQRQVTGALTAPSKVRISAASRSAIVTGRPRSTRLVTP